MNDKKMNEYLRRMPGYKFFIKVILNMYTSKIKMIANKMTPKMKKTHLLKPKTRRSPSKMTSL